MGPIEHVRVLIINPIKTNFKYNIDNASSTQALIVCSIGFIYIENYQVN